MQRALEAAMKELGETTTSEDVAAFLRTELPELAQKRKEILTKAVEEARERVVSGGETTTTSLPEPDVAFAPTVMCERQPKKAASVTSVAPETKREGGFDRPSDVGTVALVKKKDLPASEVASALDQEPIKIPKTSKVWLWLTLLLVAGGGAAFYRYPTEIKGWLAARGIGGGTGDRAVELQVVPLPDTKPTTSSASAPSDSAKPLAVGLPASGSAASSAPLASPASSSAPSARPSASASSGRPEGSGAHHTWPPGQSSAPTASAPAAPTIPWSPYKTAPPAASASDNPYQAPPP
jgi:hypothetical protein